MKSRSKPKTKSKWMRQFILVTEKKDDLAISQASAKQQLRDSVAKNRKHYITR